MGGGRGPCVSIPKASLAGDAYVSEKAMTRMVHPQTRWSGSEPARIARSRWNDAKVELATQQAVPNAAPNPLGKGPTGKLMERLDINPETMVRGSTG